MEWDYMHTYRQRVKECRIVECYENSISKYKVLRKVRNENSIHGINIDRISKFCCLPNGTDLTKSNPLLEVVHRLRH
jgi:hypothetical protein